MDAQVHTSILTNTFFYLIFIQKLEQTFFKKTKEGHINTFSKEAGHVWTGYSYILFFVRSGAIFA